MNRPHLRFRTGLALAAFVVTAVTPALFAHDHFDARSRDELVDLSGRWRFSVGDDLRWAQPDFNDHHWSRVSVPGYWEDDGYDGYNGYAWYRRSFRFSDSPNQPTYLLLGRIDDADEVYVNGQKVGGRGAFPPDFIAAWNVDRIYALPAGLLRAGEDNVIAVRVYDGASGGGIVGHSIGIYSSNLPLPEIDLAGTWKFHAGDDPVWKDPACDESDFATMPVPAFWESTSQGDLDGFGWYRKTFRATPHADVATMVLMLGKIDDTDEVYLNGTKIGSTGNLNESDRHSGADFYDQYRGYYFPASLLRDENLLAVRVHDHGGRGGIYEGPLGIISQDRYVEYWEIVRRDRRPFRSLVRALSHIHN
ncbi:beta galactosidase jelly roll domain-containing protein [Opitutus terrae]|uniref:Glycoside hydrolase family 2 sugar binding n=1 Tax=Opitutus terrae (strain DSM 11246 / JCM 15787 / PB90-1) TaxID=452637 RepID=B1ZXX2_OPITP|nr:beta galactosidase jelly roll domain-containing protein [Opitutus terrae]ACB75174.1 glycoside hydrolase family 2 sugar binding [Opitutus terrae PB90-1]